MQQAAPRRGYHGVAPSRALNNPRCRRKSSAPNIEELMGWCTVYPHAVNDAVEIRLCNMLSTSAHDSAFESLCCSVWESDELP